MRHETLCKVVLKMFILFHRVKSKDVSVAAKVFTGKIIFLGLFVSIVNNFIAVVTHLISVCIHHTYIRYHISNPY